MPLGVVFGSYDPSTTVGPELVTITRDSFGGLFLFMDKKPYLSEESRSYSHGQGSLFCILVRGLVRR